MEKESRGDMDAKKAIEIVGKLADGIDPLTGEIFPPDSPYQNVEVVRALHTAVEALTKTARQTERKKSLPGRAGQPWDKAESDLLAKRFDEGIGIPELAKEHQRTRGAIESQLAKLGKIPGR
jgi:hypothetical protein